LLIVLIVVRPCMVEPNDIDITSQRRRLATVKVIPNSVPHKACAYPAIGKPKRAYKAQHTPTERILAYDLRDEGSLSHDAASTERGQWQWRRLVEEQWLPTSAAVRR
jgi:hypothetical protein